MEEKATAPTAAAPKAPSTKKKAAPKAKPEPKPENMFVAKANLDPEKLKGQKSLVAKALKAFSTPKDVATIAAKAKDNGYKVKADTKNPLVDSVRYHLRGLVEMGFATQS